MMDNIYVNSSVTKLCLLSVNLQFQFMSYDIIFQHLQSLMKSQSVSLKPRAPLAAAPRVHLEDLTLSSPPAYKLGELVATRLAYGHGLKKLADNNQRSLKLENIHLNDFEL